MLKSTNIDRKKKKKKKKKKKNLSIFQSITLINSSECRTELKLICDNLINFLKT